MAIDRPRNITGGVRRQDETREQFRERMDEARANRGPWPSARTSTGLDEFELMNQEKNRPLADIQREAREASRRGLMYNRNTGGWVDDTMGNRSAMANANPYAQRGLQAGDPQMPPMTEPQMEWARRAQEKQSGAGALGKIGEKMGVNPYAGTRSQNIANAKATGMFDKIRDEFNKQNHRQGGSWMSEEGSIYTTDAKGEIDYDALKKHGFSWGDDDYDSKNEASAPRDWRQIQNPASKIVRNPEEFAKTKAEERALQRGSFVTPQTLSKEDEVAGVTSRVAMENPYGRGKMTTYADPAKKPRGMVKDDFGRMVPMSVYLSYKKKVQASKGMI